MERVVSECSDFHMSCLSIANVWGILHRLFGVYSPSLKLNAKTCPTVAPVAMETVALTS